MRHFSIAIFSLLTVLQALASAPINGAMDSPVLERQGKIMLAAFTLHPSAFHVKSGEALILEPLIVNGSDSLALPQVGVYGRRRWIHAERNSALMPYSLKAKTDTATLSYNQMVEWQPWMDGASLIVNARTAGCCDIPLAIEPGRSLARYYEPIIYLPEPIYVVTTNQDDLIKSRQISGRANVEFVVNRTDIRPDYRNNFAELSKIRASIDSVRNDNDVTITGIWLKGFASPESPYSHNTDLSRGRVAAVKGYVRDLYNFPDGLISTDFEPEDWQGLRQYVEESNLAARQDILALIVSDLEPDAKESAIRSRFPDDYRHLLTHAYPALRHTDYQISYVIREFTDPQEIRRLAQTDPGKLSADEFNLAAQTLETGSDEFNELYETAVRLYPNSPVACLNAASAALTRADLDRARTLLDRCPDSDEAAYLRGALLLAEGDTAAAEPLLLRARDAGIAQAQPALDTLRKIQERNQ